MRFCDSSKWITCGQVVVYLWAKRWLARLARASKNFAWFDKKIFFIKEKALAGYL
jgi:hypothetical protein